MRTKFGRSVLVMLIPRGCQIDPGIKIYKEIKRKIIELNRNQEQWWGYIQAVLSISGSYLNS